MGIVTLPSFGSDPATITAAGLDGKVDPLASEFNGNIENANIKSSAAIAASKLNLSTIAQDIAMSSSQILWAKGSDVASGTSIALGTDGNCFDITGTTTIQTITAKQAGSVVLLHFDGALTLTDDTGNLELGGSDLTVAAEDEVILKSDGTNWHLVSTTVVDLARATGNLSSGAVTVSNIFDGGVVQVVNTQDGAVATGTTAMPNDDTIPQNTEGDEYMTLAITPKSTTNKLKIEVVFNGAASGDTYLSVALFQDSTAGALASAMGQIGGGGRPETIVFTHYMTAGTASETTFKVRAGSDSTATVTFNGFSGAGKHGGVIASSITITEIKAS